MAKVSHINDGIEIDDGHCDLSASVRDDCIDVGVGNDYRGGEGYWDYQSFSLTKQEAIAFRDWLNSAIERI